jgi:hypothetical protein
VQSFPKICKIDVSCETLKNVKSYLEANVLSLFFTTNLIPNVKFCFIIYELGQNKKSSVFRDTTLCSLLKVNLLYFGLLLSQFFKPEDGGNMFLQNIT